MSSKSSADRSLGRALILAGVVILSAGGYLLASRLFYGGGFPLDDAWIHQTYARNLALRGEWAFLPGQPSAGSTAPLWSALLAVGFWLGLAPYAWAYLLGMALLWALAALAESALRKWTPWYRPRFPWAGVLIALEWHLVWLSVSGMETLLSAFLATLVLTLLVSKTRRWFGAGLLIGLAVWVRPDGVTLLGPVLLTAALSESSWKGRIRSAVKILLGFGGLFALYLLFNLLLAGGPWPNTFYAKQAEYAILLNRPFWLRLLREPVELLRGAGLLLLPGFVLTLVFALRRRDWSAVAAAAWVAGFLTLYAWRLPAVYQYGRYIMPVMPAFFLLGLAGLVESSAATRARWKRPLSLTWNLSLGVILAVFWAQGAVAYARDVAVIESEMVATARWVAVNLPPDALVAAHDIGALGYFGDHDLVDLAGLVSPEVIPFIRDEGRLTVYLDERRVDYLVTFPDWYPQLTASLNPIFVTGAPYAPALGATNMTVYRWPPP